MKKLKDIILGLLGACFVGVVLVYSFKNTFFYSVNDNVERKAEEQKEEYHREYEEMEVWADSETNYYHFDYECKGVHEDMTDKMPLYKAEQQGFEPCHFCTSE